MRLSIQCALTDEGVCTRRRTSKSVDDSDIPNLEVFLGVSIFFCHPRDILTQDSESNCTHSFYRYSIGSSTHHLGMVLCGCIGGRLGRTTKPSSTSLFHFSMRLTSSVKDFP